MAVETLETRIVKWKTSKADLENAVLNLEASESKLLQTAEEIVRHLLLNLGFFVVLYNSLAVLFTSKGNWPCFTAWIVVGITAIFMIVLGFPVTIAWNKIKHLRTEIEKLGDQRNVLKSTATELLTTLEDLKQELQNQNSNGEEMETGMVEVQIGDVDDTKLTNLGQEPNDTIVQYNKQQNLVKVICASLGLYTILFPVLAFILFCGDI